MNGVSNKESVLWEVEKFCQPLSINKKLFYFSAWFRQHFPKGHGVFAASDEHGYLLHWQGKEVPAEQRSK